MRSKIFFTSGFLLVSKSVFSQYIIKVDPALSMMIKITGYNIILYKNGIVIKLDKRK